MRKANLSETFHKASFPSVVFFARLFRKAATSVPSREIFYSFSLFSSELFFFAFSSLRCELSIREIPYSYISACIYISFLIAQKSFSHHAGARKERSRLLFLDAIVHLSSRVGGVFFL
jgi:hypothetical protein